MRASRGDRAEYAGDACLQAIQGPQHLYTTVERLPMRTGAGLHRLASLWSRTDAKKYRLAGQTTQLDQYLSLLDAGLDQQRVQAQIIIERIPNQLAILITENPEDSPFMRYSRPCLPSFPTNRPRRSRAERETSLATR